VYPVDIHSSFIHLKSYCEKEEFRGWDPYDGLNSRVFQSLPFIRNSRFFRLAWIQFFKKSPINLRRIMAVPKDYNSKGIALFLSGYCNCYSISNEPSIADKINFLSDKLLSLQSKGYSGSCWGYNFDWQARAFFQPKNTPTVVATSYAADALFNAHVATGENKYLAAALSSAAFVLKDLNRSYDKEGNFCFSYSPLDRAQVFNASLLAAKLLARAYSFTGESIFRDEAAKAVRFVCNRQRSDGSWTYGELPYHQWIDSFHTGFNLECISAFATYTNDGFANDYLQRGLAYYIENFFTTDGQPKYYHNRIHPIDVHAPAELIICLNTLGVMQQYESLAKKILCRTIEHMQDDSGYFYYQKTSMFTNRISYMRWSQAWMFYAFSCWELNFKNEHGKTRSYIRNTN
jgi:hypothetical protein